jgi:Ca2+-binding EF-hand superfamily protein
MQQRFLMMDANSDGFVDRKEVEAMVERFRNQGPPRKKR